MGFIPKKMGEIWAKKIFLRANNLFFPKGPSRTWKNFKKKKMGKKPPKRKAKIDLKSKKKKESWGAFKKGNQETIFLKKKKILGKKMGKIFHQENEKRSFFFP